MLRAHNGHVLGVFFGPLGIHECNYAALMTIENALKIFCHLYLEGHQKITCRVELQSGVTVGVGEPS